MTLEDMFAESNMQFASLMTEITPKAKFREPNMHFTGSGPE